jgi:hypothetical protein
MAPAARTRELLSEAGDVAMSGRAGQILQIPLDLSEASRMDRWQRSMGADAGASPRFVLTPPEACQIHAG